MKTAKRSHAACWILFLEAVCWALCGCGKRDELASAAKECGLDLSGAVIESVSDTHGGFHNDGCLQVVIRCGEDFPPEAMQTGAGWHELPLSAALSGFLYQPVDDGVMLPEVKRGYYYFRDRHSQSRDPYDDAELFGRYSFNFTAALFDAETGLLYYIRYDS